MRSRIVPDDAEVVRTYEELREFQKAFFRREFYFLLLVGRRGLSKSWLFERGCTRRSDQYGDEFFPAHYIKGNVTPVEAFQLVHAHQNKLLVFDDSERFWADSNGRYLLRDLTECWPVKLVNWRTSNRELERRGIPKSFQTSSRVCLIMNRFAFGDAHEYDAIVDRAQFIYFDPTPLEIHANTAMWLWDQEVYDYVGAHLNMIDPSKLSSRTYVKAYERKPKGDWKDFVARRYFSQSGEEWLLALESDPKYRSVDERVADFTRQTGPGRSTYFGLKKALRANGRLEPVPVPRFTLSSSPPEVPCHDTEATPKAAQACGSIDDERPEQHDSKEYPRLADFGE